MPGTTPSLTIMNVSIIVHWHECVCVPCRGCVRRIAESASRTPTRLAPAPAQCCGRPPAGSGDHIWQPPLPTVMMLAFASIDSIVTSHCSGRVCYANSTCSGVSTVGSTSPSAPISAQPMQVDIMSRSTVAVVVHTLELVCDADEPKHCDISIIWPKISLLWSVSHDCMYGGGNRLTPVSPGFLAPLFH